MTEPPPTPPSRFAFAGLTGLASDYEENPFDVVFGQKHGGPSSTGANVVLAATGSAGESLLSASDKEAVAVPATPYLSSSSLLNTPPPSIPSLVVTPLSKSHSDSYFDAKPDIPSSSSTSSSNVPSFLSSSAPIPTSPAGDPNLGLRLLAEAPLSRSALQLGGVLPPPLRSAAAQQQRQQQQQQQQRKNQVNKVNHALISNRMPPNRMGRPRHSTVNNGNVGSNAGHQVAAAAKGHQIVGHHMGGMVAVAAAVAAAGGAKQQRKLGRGAETTMRARGKKRPSAAMEAEEDGDGGDEDDGSADGHEGIDDRRKQFLTRNKVAASKCRAKKKKWMTDLEIRAAELANANTELHSQLGRLRGESDILREILLAHRDCNCTKIQQYVQTSSAKLHNMLTMPMVMQPGLYAPLNHGGLVAPMP